MVYLYFCFTCPKVCVKKMPFNHNTRRIEEIKTEKIVIVIELKLNCT